MNPGKPHARSAFLQAGHVPRKRFGQNFLVDPGVIHGIVAAIDPQPDDNLAEIGPGLGALTDPLLERLDRLHALEIDRDLIVRLKRRFHPERLIVHTGDALAFDFGQLEPDLRVAGNLPYNISTPLLFHLARFADRIRDMHFMLQKEVVERMVAQPGSPAYGRLSVMLQYRFHLEKLFDVPPKSFNPSPRVWSALVRLIPRPAAERALCDIATLEKVAAAAFSQRRKMLRNTLKAQFAEDELAALGIAPDKRAEDIPLAGFIALANARTKAELLAKVHPENNLKEPV
ncbi:MAG: 16S rRNA (adenine(1518)-N(6)/adenine(1519)-N(6))-dimethyltransferase RsmA [Zoogloeaceae bacterium]|jgi:16S rRNA (adenine1518-N6/adenine1519-N6)-dimethyltransferase|nr:16S rRNA (adenine(1518)-N(6)/adenine(1519)-N(6))-dimethyltransferase RsmA [Zoogloeaceae bacterium]